MDRMLSRTKTGALVCLMLSSLAAAGSSTRLTRSIEASLATLTDTTALSGKTIAMGAVKNQQGVVTELGILIARTADRSLGELAKARGHTMVDRGNLDRLVREWALGQTGLVDENTATAAGNLCGVDYFCFATYGMVGRRMSAWFKLVDAESGTVVATTECTCRPNRTQRKLAKLPAKPVVEQTSPTGLTVRVWTDKTAYAVGDKITIHFETNQDCYLTLIDIDARGNATVLFPNRYNRENRIEAGRTYTIPGDRMGFDFYIEPPGGVDIIKAIASLEPVVSLKELFDSIGELEPFAGIDDPSMLTRGIRVEGRKAKPGTWAEATTRYTITE